eukprot:864578-Rhodomonas_salina.2
MKCMFHSSALSTTPQETYVKERQNLQPTLAKCLKRLMSLCPIFWTLSSQHPNQTTLNTRT